jgi:hypothetical protein
MYSCTQEVMSGTYYSTISKCVELIYAFLHELCSVLSRNLCVQLVQTIIKIRAITGTMAFMK